MLLNQSISVDEIPEDDGGDFAPVPAGWYTASINSAEIKQTEAGNGSYINIRYDITGATHEGRAVWGMITLENYGVNKVKAESIGRQQLGQIMRAIGLNQVTDTDQLVGGNLQIKLGIKRSEEYGDRNKVIGYKAMASGSSHVPVMDQQPQQTHQPQQQQQSSSTPPWLK